MLADTADASGTGSVYGVRRAVILLGAPGSGKGTQAQRIAQKLGIPHLSTGDMFRDHVSRGSELGRKARPYMDRGELVPDEIVLAMVEERVGRPDCAKGLVLDGFPRTLPQAEGLERIFERLRFSEVLVLYLDVQREALFRRLTGRRICKAGAHIYNVFERPPKHEGICDMDGSPLIQRSDDTEAAIGERLAAYDRQTRPLVDYYRTKGRLNTLDGMAEPDAVTSCIMKNLAGAKIAQ